MLARVAYYGFVIPISYLPFPILYGLSTFLSWIFIYLFPYRKEVIDGNMRRSFPEKSEAEIKQMRNQFYRHFCDILVEGIKNLTISQKQLSRRMRVQNPKVVQSILKQQKNILLVSGHYNNWEWLISSQSFLFGAKAFGIGMPLTSKFWDKKVNERRSRFGMNVVSSANYREELTRSKSEPHTVLVLSDQSPGDSKKSFWTDFLHQKTAILFGAEIIANELDYAVVYFTTHKRKRGFYELELTEITTSPRQEEWGFITKSHAKMLEQAIRKSPINWLWSHKRWKREVPQDLDSLARVQREKFNGKYRKEGRIKSGKF